MSKTVLTPLTQVLNDGILTRTELKAFMRRSNGPALRNLAAWVVLLCSTTALIYVTKNTLWFWPMMFVQGIIIVHHFSLQHECVHYTAFKTRWLNNLIGNICGVIIILPHQYFRYEHCDHHTYTQVPGQDPELIELPKSITGYLAYLSAVPYWRVKFGSIFRNAAGIFNDAERSFIPSDVRPSLVWEARTYLLVYCLIGVSSVLAGWTGALWYWLIPLFLGEPVMRFIRMTEHVGKPAIKSMKENTRTTYVFRPAQFLCWNMNYHAEHHYASSVPFHALPRLHETLKTVISVEPRGYWGAHVDILEQLLGKRPRADLIREANE